MNPVRRYCIAAGLAGLLTALALYFALVSLQIGGAIVASGVVQTKTAKQPIQHVNGGFVQASFVSQGERVSAGDPLVQMAAPQLEGELTRLRNRDLLLRLEIARLHAEQRHEPNLQLAPDLQETISDNPALANAHKTQERLLFERRELERTAIAGIDSAAHQTKLEIAGLELETDALDHQIELLQTERDAQTALLQQGLARASTVAKLRLDLAALAAERAGLSTDFAKAQSRLVTLQSERLAVRAGARERASAALSQAERELVLTNDRLAELQLQLEANTLRAPFSGWVGDMRPLPSGAFLAAGQQAMVIVPEDQGKYLDARIDPRFARQVAADQSVWIRLAGPGGNAREPLQGRVIEISRDALVDPASQDTYFQARIELIGPTDHLIAGTPAEVFFATGSRNVMTYLVEPVAHYLGRALRES